MVLSRSQLVFQEQVLELKFKLRNQKELWFCKQVDKVLWIQIPFPPLSLILLG